jgi:hypothetical protein
MADNKFWRWYDRGARMDFGGTVLGFFFDWKGWLAAAVGSSGGAMTFLKAAMDGRDPLDVWVLATIVAAALAVFVYFSILALERNKKPKAGEREKSAGPDKIGVEFTNGIPDVRIADDAAIWRLFETKDRDLLFPLLERGKLDAWGRLGNGPLTKIPSEQWAAHYLDNRPADGPGRINQTFFRPRSRPYESTYYDVHLNRAQVESAWPDAAKNETFYSRAEIDEMLAAMRRISVLVNQTAVAARDSAQELMNQWAHILDKKGKSEFMAEMDLTQQKVQAVVDETWEIVKDYRHYHDEIGPILNAANFSGKFFQAIGEFRNAASVLPGESGYGATLNLVMPQHDEFALATRALQDWMTVAFDRLEATTKRLRGLRSSVSIRMLAHGPHDLERGHSLFAGQHHVNDAIPVAACWCSQRWFQRYARSGSRYPKLRRGARKSNSMPRLRQNNATGKSAKTCPALS